MLQTRKSPSDVCDVSMSDFCLEDEACQAKPTIGDGERDVFSVCKTVKEGCRLAMMMEPFLYLCEQARQHIVQVNVNGGTRLSLTQ